jgi:uncharacterized protein YbjT (DUF2867 family)
MVVVTGATGNLGQGSSQRSRGQGQPSAPILAEQPRRDPASHLMSLTCQSG